MFLVFAVCLILLPVQVYAYGGGGDGDEESGRKDPFARSDAGSGGGAPMTFTPPGNIGFDIPDSYTNPGVADSTTVFPDSDVKRAIQERERNSGFLHRTEGHVYDALASVGGGAVIAGKVAIKGLAVLGATAGVLAAAPVAAGAAGTAAALGVAAAAIGGAALVGGALMQGAETYGEGIDAGKSQADAASHGMTSGLAKGAIDTAISLDPALGAIDHIKKAMTGGKGLGDSIHEEVTNDVSPKTPMTRMTPTDA
jgi:hypothetical protein